MKLTKETIKKYIHKKNKYLHKNFNVKKIGLFGSFARNEESIKSDIDFLVEFDKTIGLFKFAELQRELSENFNRTVDLVTIKALKPLLKQTILDEVEWIEGL